MSISMLQQKCSLLFLRSINERVQNVNSREQGVYKAHTAYT